MQARRVVPFVVLAVAAAVVFLWPTNHPDDSLVAPETSTTTTPFVSGIYGSSWSVLRGAPVSGRERMALAGVDGKIFVFGGVVAGFGGADLSPDRFLQDGWLYDPAEESWELVPPPSFAMCALADPAALAGGFWAPVVVWGRVDRDKDPDCINGAAYDPDSRTWRPLPQFFDVVVSTGSRVFLDEIPGGSLTVPNATRLVAPELGLSLDLISNVMIALDSPSATVVPVGGAEAAYTWTGEWYVGVDRGLLFAWNARQERWSWSLGGTPLEPGRLSMVATEVGLVLINQTLQAAVLESLDAPWRSMESVPLRAGGCGPQAVSVGGKPVVFTCVGVAVYEPASGGWVPFPTPIGIEGSLLATDDALYWFSGEVSRLEFLPGGVLAPARLPIGLTEILLPDGYQFASSIGLVQTMDAERRVLSEVHGFDVATPRGDVCSVIASYQPTAELSEPLGSITVDRPVLPDLIALDYSQGGLSRYVVETSPTDTVEVRCGRDDDARALVAALQWIKV